MGKKNVALVGSLVLVAAAGIAGIVHAATSTADNLIGGEYLFPGQRIISAACYYRLVMQSDGNLVTYGGSTAYWATNTVNTGGYALLGGDGNFLVRNWADVPIFATGTIPHSGARVVQKDGGNLVIYDGATPLWATGVSGPSIGQTPCPQSTKTQVTKNVDRPGGDFQDLILGEARPTWCGYYCSQNSSCKAWTYVPPASSGDGQPHCFLKSSVPGTSSRTGFWSGKIIKF